MSNARFCGVRMTHVKDHHRALVLPREVKALLEKDTIEQLDRHSQVGGFYFTYFIIPMKDSGRIVDSGFILDLNLLNAYLKALPFHLLHTVEMLQGIRQGNWFILHISTFLSHLNTDNSFALPSRARPTNFMSFHLVFR